jgi:integrase
MRTPVDAWRHVAPTEVLEAYLAVGSQLRGEGVAHAAVTRALNNLYRFACLTGSPDIRQLSGAREDMERARSAWTAMRADGRWSPKHVTRVRTSLARALACVAPSLAGAVHPTQRHDAARAAVRFTATRSFERAFDLHSCLPVRIRQLSPFHAEYELLHRILDEMSAHLRSVSKSHLQRLAWFLDTVIHGHAAAGLAPLWGDVPPAGLHDAGARWAWLRRLPARRWLSRLGEVHRREGRRVSFDHFKRHVRYLHLLYGRVLNATGSVVPIPTPTTAGRVYCSEGLTALSSGSSQSATSDADGVQQNERRALREQVTALRAELCEVTDQIAELDRVFAFAPAEVRAIVEAAVSARERLVVLLFLTTGLRIGGLSRLHVPDDLSETRAVTAAQVPEYLNTIEKNGKVRKVRLSNSCRVLVARWYGSGRPPGASRYLFPGSRAGKPLSTRYLWDVCHEVFRRARVAGRHVHPHTFRHTVIQMLYMRGLGFDAIAKWIGHANPSITSGVYGRLSQRDLNGMMRGVLFTDDDNAGEEDAKRAWVRLSRFIADPYVFDEDETAGLKRRPQPPPARAQHVSAIDLQGVVHRMVVDEMAKLRE